ncbi:sigma-70 family RNA polymerase sigma factor [Salmonella enterica]|nr:sigma-70 family RNA polymerase sigma factor [Salmonella enterica]
MHKIRDMLRLRFEAGLSFRQISQCVDVSTGAIQKILKPPDAVGVSWPLTEGMSESRLASLLYPESGSRPGELEDPNWSDIHFELRKKVSPGTCCGRSTVSGCQSGPAATLSYATATRLVSVTKTLHAPAQSFSFKKSKRQLC